MRGRAVAPGSRPSWERRAPRRARCRRRAAAWESSRFWVGHPPSRHRRRKAVEPGPPRAPGRQAPIRLTEQFPQLAARMMLQIEPVAEGVAFARTVVLAVQQMVFGHLPRSISRQQRGYALADLRRRARAAVLRPAAQIRVGAQPFRPCIGLLGGGQRPVGMQIHVASPVTGESKKTGVKRKAPVERARPALERILCRTVGISLAGGSSW